MAKRKAKATRKKATRKTAKKATRKTTKKATKKATRKKATKKAAAKTTTRAPKIARVDKPRTKSAVYAAIAEQTGLARKEVVSVFEALSALLATDLSKRGPGAMQVPGLMKVTVKRMPATKARKGINPFTKEPTIFKAKPARNVVKVRPLAGLKALV